MKNLPCVLLVVVLLIMVIAQYAYADNDHAPVVYDVEASVLYEWSKTLGLNEQIKESWYDWHEPLISRLTGNDPPDFFVLRTYNDNYAQIRDSELLADISVSDAIRNDILTMPSVFSSLLTDESGAIYGIPESITLMNELYWIPNTWKNSGFPASLIPDSFETLLGFLEFYLETPHDEYCIFYYTSNPNVQYTYRRWLTDWLVCAWNAQRKYTNEEMDEQQLMNLVSRAIDIGERLDQSEPNSEQEKRELIPLFHGGIRGRGLTFDGKYSYTLHSIVPQRITSNQPALITIGLSLVCCRANSNWADSAPAMLEMCIQHRPDWVPFYCHPDQGDLEAYNAQIQSGYSHMCFTPDWLESLNTSNLIPIAPVSLTSSDEYYQLTMQLFYGEITSEQYVRDIMQMMKND